MAYRTGEWVKMRGLYIATGKLNRYMDGGKTVEVIEPNGTIHWMHAKGILLATKSDIARKLEKDKKEARETALAQEAAELAKLESEAFNNLSYKEQNPDRLADIQADYEDPSLTTKQKQASWRTV